MAPITLTVVIPTFNRSSMLKRCVGSILGGVRGIDELESRVRVIVVDDASDAPDALSALEELSLSFPEPLLKVERLQQNSGGAAAPRNTALDQIKTDYVFFVDSDDYLGAEAIPRALQILDENRPDYLSLNSVNDGNRSDKSGNIKDGYVERDLRFALKSLVVRRIFRVSLIANLGLRFDDYLKSSQDVLFTFQYLLNAKTFGFAGGYDYYHLVEHTSGLEDGHLSRKAGRDGFSSSLRAGYALYILEKGLLELTAVDLSENMKAVIAAQVLVPRVFGALKFPGRLRSIDNAERQRGLFREFANILKSPLLLEESLGLLKPEHLLLVEAARSGDLNLFLARAEIPPIPKVVASNA
jgi:glycosyltransferase involved in cell wall biosynthesis